MKAQLYFITYIDDYTDEKIEVYVIADNVNEAVKKLTIKTMVDILSVKIIGIQRDFANDIFDIKE